MIEIDAAVFSGAGLEQSGRGEFDGASLEAEFEWPAIGAHNGRGPHPDEGVVLRGGPARHIPPVVQLASAGEVGADYDDRLPVFRAGDGVGEGNRQSFRAQRGFDFIERVRGESLVFFRDYDYVGSVVSELGAELGLHVDVEIHHRGCDGGGDHHGKQGGGGASATENGGADEHAHEHGGVRRLCATLGDLLGSVHCAREPYSCFTSQGEDGVEFHRAANGGCTSRKGYEDSNRENDGEQHGLDRNLRVEDGAANLAGEQRSGGEPGDASDQREEHRFYEEDGRDRKVAGAESFHQADLAAALENGGGHSGRDGEGRGKERGQRDEQHQTLDAREYGAFVLGDLANLLGVRVRDRFLELVGDRLHVGRAVPAIVDFRASWFSDRGRRARLAAW